MELKAELAVVFAAGRGVRLRSSVPKVMQPLAGLSLLGHVVGLSFKVARRVLVVVSSELESICRDSFPEVIIVVQEHADGTGGAARCALSYADQHGVSASTVVFINADTPLVEQHSLERLLGALRGERAGLMAALVVLGFHSTNPHGYGRLLGAEVASDMSLPLAASKITEVREDEDCTSEELAHPLCNAGVYATKLDRATLLSRLESLPLVERSGGRAAERRMTDLVRICVENGERVLACWTHEEEAVGVNTVEQLAYAEEIWQRRARAEKMSSGVFFRSSASVFLSHDTVIGRGTIVEPYVVFGNGVEVGMEALIRSFSYIEGARIAPRAEIGPFARLRASSDIGVGAKVGSFVETKNAKFSANAKAPHLSYVGDCDIGESANIGAGVITCNYDGIAKHTTQIGAGAFIGSNSSLIAPVSIGSGAKVGASSAVDRDVPADSLALERSALLVKPLGKGKV